ncbi:hypothetical protein ACFVVU_23595 [Kitasatospora sp. NPDC057965]|uniref:hypothetical protein n=1 Tax=Kitasatospora sp. NPDC057965 TaxID=3346291 RepID=UPI0036DCC50A
MTNEPAEFLAIHHDPHRKIDIIYLPEVPYYDIQAGAVEIGLDREWVTALRDFLTEWLLEDAPEEPQP